MQKYTADEIAKYTATPATLGKHVGKQFMGKQYKVYEWVLQMEREVLSMLYRPGPEILLVSVPPQEGKSTYCSMFLPAWFLGHHPDKTVINVSYNETQAAKWGLRTLLLMKIYGEALFGVRVNPDSDAKNDWKLGNGFGGMMSVGIRGGITGNPGDLILLDDTLKGREEANSPTIKQKNLEEWHDSITSRFQENSKVLVVATRWCEDDLSGEIWAEAQKPGYDGFPVSQMNFKAIAEPDRDELREMDNADQQAGVEAEAKTSRRHQWRDRLGRREGEGLKGQHSQRFFELKRNSTPAPRWQSLHQGTPGAASGGMFPEENWRFWTHNDYDGRPLEVAVLPEIVKRVRMWDLAASDGAGDWTVGSLWGRSADGRFFLLNLQRERLAPGGVKELVTRTASEDGYEVAIRIERERSGAGITVVDDYKRLLLGYDVDGMKAEGDKTQRAGPYSRLQNAFLCHLPLGADWIDRFTGNHSQMDGRRGLPKYDDEVDTGAYAMMFLLGQGDTELWDANALDATRADLTDDERWHILMVRETLGIG